jgi:cysteine desulfurase
MGRILNVAIPGLDSEDVMLALKDVVAISNGSACTSQNYTASHVLTAMGLSQDRIARTRLKAEC